LKRRPRGETERRFVEKCEASQAATTDELWTQVCAEFNPADFPRRRRMFRQYMLMALGSLAIYWVTIALIIYNTFQEVK
jgi:hypothetical protein